ncbi:MAG TPA: phosphate acetyltransferase [Candidatus Agrococcus pullicola]|uniref:Phosphate acetyltransferase n=1 Tax=Candidatus Agrococcus pullicola TaxID=2838429 RepID=A0A9D2CAC4_9MICO|nr:phosphate acetyltransferase [Candidatus Agrococcus pullicola]
MTRIVIASPEGHTGKSIVALGLIDALSRRVRRVGVFRPVVGTKRDAVLTALLEHDAVVTQERDAIGVDYESVHEDPARALATIVDRFHDVDDASDAVVILGSDYTDVASPAELEFNARVAANVDASVVLVLGGFDPDTREPRTAEQLRQLAVVALGELRAEHASLGAIIVNRAASDAGAIRNAIATAIDVPVSVIENNPVFSAPTVGDLFAAADADFVRGDEWLLDRPALGTVVAGMSMENVLDRLIDGGVLVVPGDRSDVVVGALLAQQSETFPTVSGIILNGGFDLPSSVQRLLDGLGLPLPIAKSSLGTYDTARAIAHTRGSLLRGARERRELALATFEKSVDVPKLLDNLEVQQSGVVTPLIFEHKLIERARSAARRIVLPEGTDDRILEAAAIVLRRGVAEPIILGDEAAVRARASELRLDLTGARVVPTTSGELLEKYVAEYGRLRAHKGITADQARDRVQDVSYFGTMMVKMGDADGMVSGAAHTTAHTIRPSFEVIKTKPGVRVVSSVFLMALADRVLVYGDCAVIPEPTAEQLADIAVSSAATAEEFGIEPRVAMLSYSTGESGSGEEVDKVREATALVRERAPQLQVDGPMQYDAAADPTVAAKKMPGSDVAGRATVFVFPDLNTGNNTYKAVQRSANAVAMGPVLQGLNAPVNDLSRGATVADIVNTIAITAIQAAGRAEVEE